AILLYGIWRAQRATRLFLLIYLLATVFGLMAGSYIFKPMYLGPHHIMVGSPAFILLLALGIWHMPMPTVGRLLALGLVLWAQGVSLRNFYFDSAYAKEDYRALVQFIEARAGEHDLVLYNDAILLPLQQHYQQRADLPFTASPMYPYSLDDARNPTVADVVAGFERVWFVPAHPSDGRDDAGVVEAALQEMGAVFLQQPFHGRNADVRVDGYAIGTQMAQLPDDAKLLANPMLPLAVRVSDVEWRSLWVELFWDGGMVSAETEITIQLRDTTNTVWSSYTSQFLAEASAPIVKTTHGLQLPLGLPPATYQLWINVGEWQQLTTVEIVASVSAETTPSPTGIMFENGIELVSVELAAETTFAGNPLPATLLWRIHDLQALPDSEFELTVLGSAGELRRDKQPLLADWVAAEKLTPNTLFAQQIGIYPRPDTAPDTYRLLWKLLQAGQPQVTAQGLDSAEMGRFSVLAWPFVSEIPAVDNLVDSVDNSFGDDITLQAFTISDNEPAAGEQLAITLYWQPLAQPAANWSVFVHLVQSATDQPLAQANGTPVNGLRPTKGWRPQEIISDEYQLQLPADLAAGSYQIYVGFFDTETFARYPVVVDGIAQPFDQLLLTTIQVR
ncbi:MAG TPA: hypothetical protein ENJ56_06055, partial [Anaerolineae bacterium]|nr:hypothetical protein [Anaerolineae bacterium]